MFTTDDARIKLNTTAALAHFIPIAFITTVPAEAIVGRATPGSALTALLVAGLLVAVSRWFWRFALRNYTSASS